MSLNPKTSKDTYNGAEKPKFINRIKASTTKFIEQIKGSVKDNIRQYTMVIALLVICAIFTLLTD